MMPKKPKTATYEDAVIELATVQPHPRNPRIHPEPGTSGWKKLIKSLDYDYYDPLVYNKRNNCWVSGHLRAKVLISQGITHAKVVVVDYPEDIHIARMIAANKQVGEWDFPSLKDLIIEIDTGAFDMGLTLFGEDELESLVAIYGEDTKLKNVEISAPALTWVLIGIPTVNFSLIAETVEKIGQIDGIILKTTVASNEDEKD
ncbi:MAG: hypothetical protein PHV74_14460 [Dehalococcoidia bacterium]|nr:hypothetical protein [Dehalococcoidia bacterium]